MTVFLKAMAKIDNDLNLPLQEIRLPLNQKDLRAAKSARVETDQKVLKKVNKLGLDNIPFNVIRVN